MSVKVDFNVDDIQALSLEEKVRAVCQKEGCYYVGLFEGAQKGNQAALYQVKKENDEYILKYYYKPGQSAGGYGRGYFKEDGSFDEREYEKTVKQLDDDFKIEKALATDQRLKDNPHIVDVVAADRITFYDGAAKLTEYYSIMKKYRPLSLDKNADPNIRNELEALRLGIQICDALITLNDCKLGDGGKGIFHSDIKYDNIFCYEDEDGSWEYVLSDFGMSKLKGSQSSFSMARGGTLYTMAPELISRNYSTKADLYSLCATIYLLVNKGVASEAKPKSRVIEDFRGSKIIGYSGTMPSPTNCSRELQELLVNGLEFDKEKRRCKSAKELKIELQRIQFSKSVAFKEKIKKKYEQAKVDNGIDDSGRLLKCIVWGADARGKLDYEMLGVKDIIDPSLMEDIGEYLFDVAKYLDKNIECIVKDAGVEEKEEKDISWNLKNADMYLSVAAENPTMLKAKYLHGIVWSEKDPQTSKRMFKEIINAPLSVQKKYHGVKERAQKALKELDSVINEDYHIDDVLELSEKEKVKYVLRKEGYKYFKSIEGPKSTDVKIYQIKREKDSEEHILKYYGNFKNLTSSSANFLIEEALATDESVKRQPGSLDVVAVDTITFNDGLTKVREAYSIVKKSLKTCVYEKPTDMLNNWQDVFVNRCRFIYQSKWTVEELKATLQKILFTHIFIVFVEKIKNLKGKRKIDLDTNRNIFTNLENAFKCAGLEASNIDSIELMEDIGEFIFDYGKSLTNDDFLSMQAFRSADGYLSKAAKNPRALKAKYLHGIILCDELMISSMQKEDKGQKCPRELAKQAEKRKEIQTMFKNIIDAPDSIQKEYPEIKERALTALRELG